VWLERDGSRLSTLDLFGHGFVLLTGAGAAWREAAEGVAMDLGVPLAAFAVGLGGDLGDPDKRWAAAYGVGSDGAVLVRPDGHVGWRSSAGPSQPRAQVARALRTLVATWS
jgi:hypothetical protein